MTEERFVVTEKERARVRREGVRGER